MLQPCTIAFANATRPAPTSLARRTPKALRPLAATSVALVLGAVLAACGGGGGDTDTTAQPPNSIDSEGANGRSARWLNSAAHTALDGSADGGLDGPLRVVHPALTANLGTLQPGEPLSRSHRIVGGEVDATLGSLTGAGVRHLVYDALVPASAAGSVGFYKVDLGAQGSAVPVAQRLSTETAPCAGTSGRFTVIGQSLAGDEATLHYHAATAASPCSAGGEPRVVTLSMSAGDAPIALDAATDSRVTPIGPIHNGAGRVAAYLGWQGGRFVRTDATLRLATPLDAGDLGGPVDATAAPTQAGWVTRFGIFVVSGDGLRRYDKSSGRLSAVLVPGRVARGAQIPMLADADALYLTALDDTGRIDLYRVPDSASAIATRLNTEGPLDAVGFRLTKSHVLYALQGRDDWTAWAKSSGTRRAVLSGRAIVLASTLHDTLYTRQGSGGELFHGPIDGGTQTALGTARLLAGSLADDIPPFARLVRGNAAFSHALLLRPAAGSAGLSRATVLWRPFEEGQASIDAGALPDGLGDTVTGPGVTGAAALFEVAATTGAATRLFTAMRSGNSLRAVNTAP